MEMLQVRTTTLAHMLLQCRFGTNQDFKCGLEKYRKLMHIGDHGGSKHFLHMTELLKDPDFIANVGT